MGHLSAGSSWDGLFWRKESAPSSRRKKEAGVLSISSDNCLEVGLQSGSACLGLKWAELGSAGLFWSVSVIRFGLVWLELILFGLVQFGLIRSCLDVVWLGLMWFDLALSSSPPDLGRRKENEAK